jgi:predicted P-loop ATPase
MGGYVVAGHLSEAEAFDGLVVAGKQAGKPSKEVERTVRDGLVLGRDTPRGAPPREDPGPSPDLKATPPTDEDLGVDHTLQVRRQLHRAKKTGLPAVSLHNAITVLMEDPCYRGRLTWDAFIGRAEIDGRPLLDADVIELRRAINAEYGLNIGRDLGSDAVLHVASQSKHDPLRDYLDGLVWDGTERCTWLLARYFGASNDELSKSYSVKWMISAVARAMDPGCKVDTILVLRGVQSAKKSTGLEALVPVQDWFSDSDVDVQSKEGAISIQGKWVVEIAELESFRGKAQTAIKAFLSRRIDHFRAPYGRIAEDHPRRTVFVGSTNAETFLSDPTGSRRLWVVEAQHVDVLGLRRERDQLWAEAVIRYRRGETWWLSADEDLARGVSAEDYQIQEPWEPLILTWLQLPATKLMLASGITTTDAMRLALAIEPARMTRGAEMDVANILRKLGLKRRRLRGSGSVREYRYSP